MGCCGVQHNGACLTQGADVLGSGLSSAQKEIIAVNADATEGIMDLMESKPHHVEVN